MEDATLVMLGCGWKYCTQFHRYEEQAAVPYRYYKEFVGQADFADGAASMKRGRNVRPRAGDKSDQRFH